MSTAPPTPRPEAVERIVLKCLAKDANDRFASMAELRDALRGAQSELERQKTVSTLDAKCGAPAPAPVKPQPQAAKPIKPIQPATATPRSGGIKPALLIGGAAAVVVIGVIIALALISRGSAPQSVAPAAPASTLAPASAQVQALLDQGYQQMLAGNLDMARETCAQALKIEPNSAQALVARAVIEMYDGKDMKQAAADIQAAASTMQDDPSFHLASGLLHHRSDEHLDPPLAERDISQAIETCGDKMLLCAAAYEERGKRRKRWLSFYRSALKPIRTRSIVCQSHFSITTLGARFSMTWRAPPKHLAAPARPT